MHDGKHILLADDDPRDVELILAALGHAKLAKEIAVVPDGAEALDYLYGRGRYGARGNDRPVVVLLDLKMPKVDGLEVLRIIKADAQLKIIPVVMLTSSREEADLLESYRCGANAYLVKPVDCDHFMEVVKELGVFWGLVNEPPPLRVS